MRRDTMQCDAVVDPLVDGNEYIQPQVDEP